MAAAKEEAEMKAFYAAEDQAFEDEKKLDEAWLQLRWAIVVASKEQDIIDALEKLPEELAETLGDIFSVVEADDQADQLRWIRSHTLTTETIDGDTIQVRLVDWLAEGKWSAIDQHGGRHVVLASLCR